MSKDRVLLQHILDAIDGIMEFTRDGRGAFFSDRKTQRAVICDIQVIGEAVKNLSAGFRAAHPDIPWRAIAGMRDTLSHRYFQVKLDVVWEVVRRDLPELRSKIEAFLQKQIDSNTNLQPPAPPPPDPPPP